MSSSNKRGHAGFPTRPLINILRNSLLDDHLLAIHDDDARGGERVELLPLQVVYPRAQGGLSYRGTYGRDHIGILHDVEHRAVVAPGPVAYGGGGVSGDNAGEEGGGVTVVATCMEAESAVTVVADGIQRGLL